MDTELTEISKEIEESHVIDARITTFRKRIKDSKPIVNNGQKASPVYVQENVVKPRSPRLTLPKF